MLADRVLVGIGSGGPGFNNYRPHELEFLIALLRDLKQKSETERRRILTDYDAFFDWITSVPQKGSRQFRHMLRYFAFPDRVERISSNNDRRKILEGFRIGSRREIADWNDRQLDEKLMQLRTRLQLDNSNAILHYKPIRTNQRVFQRLVLGWLALLSAGVPRCKGLVLCAKVITDVTKGTILRTCTSSGLDFSCATNLVQCSINSLDWVSASG